MLVKDKFSKNGRIKHTHTQLPHNTLFQHLFVYNCLTVYRSPKVAAATKTDPTTTREGQETSSMGRTKPKRVNNIYGLMCSEKRSILCISAVHYINYSNYMVTVVTIVTIVTIQCSLDYLVSQIHNNIMLLNFHS